MRISICWLFALVLGAPAYAIDDFGENSLGVYFDYPPCHCVGPTTPIQANVPFDMYFVVANPVVDVMGGFEFAWAFDPVVTPAPVILDVTLPPIALNIGTSTNFIVGLGSGLVTSEATLLVTLRIMFTQVPSWSPTWITVGPAVPASHPGHMAFNDFNNPANIYDMYFHYLYQWYPDFDGTGWVRPGVGWLVNCYPVAVEETTWSQVKAVFE
jgi:hypothetical protein